MFPLLSLRRQQDEIESVGHRCLDLVYFPVKTIKIWDDWAEDTYFKISTYLRNLILKL